jgi:hypothetical protein
MQRVLGQVCRRFYMEFIFFPADGALEFISDICDLNAKSGGQNA